MKISSIGMNETEDARIDSDEDGLSNLDEFTGNRDPCSSMKSLDTMTGIESSSMPAKDNQSEPLMIVIKQTSGLGSGEKLLSVSGNTVTLNNGSETIKSISNSKLEQVRTKLNDSGFFDALNYYAPANNSQESNQSK